MSDRYIKAEHVELALVARKIAALQIEGGKPAARWAAMSDGVSTQDCSRRRSAYRLPVPPLMMPMHRGQFDRVIERTRLACGLAEVRRIWGVGLRALQAETRNHCLPAEGAP